MNEKISIIVPCYNEQDSIPKLMESIFDVISTMQNEYNILFELILVDDGSEDDSLSLMKRYAHSYGYVHYISFSRNFGKESAMYAGLKHANGDYVVILDADLQHPPQLIIQMYNVLKYENYECCAPCRDRKYESYMRAFFAHLYYKIINKISDTNIKDGAGDFRMMKRNMVDAILSLNEYNIFLKGIFGWVGFRTKWLPYEDVKRAAGKSKWSFWKLFKYSLQGILAFSTVPLAFASLIGMLTCLISVIMILAVLAKTLIFGEIVTGFPTLVCLVLFIGGINLLCIGILGQYQAKSYLEIKNRPKYIIAEQTIRARGEPNKPHIQN